MLGVGRTARKMVTFGWVGSQELQAKPVGDVKDFMLLFKAVEAIEDFSQNCMIGISF